MTGEEDVRMTREEEIRAKLVDCSVFYTDSTRNFYTVAIGDMEYLLARNEELQRENEKMQAVVDAATRLNGSLHQDNNTGSTWTLVQGYLLGDLNAALVGMWSEDAKEQDDD